MIIFINIDKIIFINTTVINRRICYMSLKLVWKGRLGSLQPFRNRHICCSTSFRLPMMDCICLSLAVPVSTILHARYVPDQGKHLFPWVGPSQVSGARHSSSGGFITEFLFPFEGRAVREKCSIPCRFPGSLGKKTEQEFINV